MKIFLLDNYDSFTYNIAQLLEYIDVHPVVKRDSEVALGEIEAMSPDAIMISPGPMRPRDHPLIFDVLRQFHKKIPILGICLGMQAINEFFGGGLKHANVPVHGKTSLIYHRSENIFCGIPSPFVAARYHSLVVGKVPSELEITAKTRDGVVMALSHKSLPIFGVQFHPESYLTEYGTEIISNFLNM